MATVNIRREGSSFVWDPPTITLGANDFIVFANLDPEAPHQPTLVGQSADYWFDDELPAFEDGQPAACSPAINLAGATGTSIQYEDGLNPGGLTGTISF